MLICPIEYYPNCRVCGCGHYQKVMFFKTEKEMIDYAIKNIKDIAILNVYNSFGELVASFNYELNKHECIGITYTTFNPCHKYRTTLNQHNDLAWEQTC